MKFQNKLSAIAAIVFVMDFAALAHKAGAQSTKPPWRNLTLDQLSVFTGNGFIALRYPRAPFSMIPASTPSITSPTSLPQAAADSCCSWAARLPLLFTITGNVLGQVTRPISIKAGTSLFFPLIDAEWDNVLTTPHLGGVVLGHPSGVPVLKQVVAASVDSTTGLFATLNSSSVPFPRLRSGAFAFRLPATDNLYQFFGVNVSGTVAPAVSDGFFSFIPSLAAGNYVLRFGGQFPIDTAGHQFIEDITYNITVTP